MPTLTATITSDQALRTARLDAEKAYRDLTTYCIRIELADDGWHVDYELKTPLLNGGGPHYIIDPVSGQITWKKYEQ